MSFFAGGCCLLPNFASGTVLGSTNFSVLIILIGFLDSVSGETKGFFPFLMSFVGAGSDFDFVEVGFLFGLDSDVLSTVDEADFLGECDAVLGVSGFALGVSLTSSSAAAVSSSSVSAFNHWRTSDSSSKSPVKRLKI